MGITRQKFDQFLELHKDKGYSPQEVFRQLESEGYDLEFSLAEEVEPVAPQPPVTSQPSVTSEPVAEGPLGHSWVDTEAYQAHKDRSLLEKTGHFVSTNLPQSALQFGKDVGSVVAHPLQTVKGMGGLIASTTAKIRNKAVGDDSGKGEEIFDAVAEMYTGRYGSYDKAVETAYFDPIGFLGDASLFLTGVGAAVGGSARAANLLGKVSRLGAASKVAPKLAKFGKDLHKASDVVDIGQLAMGGAVKGVLKGGKIPRTNIKVPGAIATYKKMTPRLMQQAVLTPTRVPKWAARASAAILARAVGTSPVAVEESVRIFRRQTTPEVVRDRIAWEKGKDSSEKLGLVETTRQTVKDYRNRKGDEYASSQKALDLSNKPVSAEGLEEAIAEIQERHDFDIDAPVGKRYQRSKLFGEKDAGPLTVTLNHVKAFLDGVKGRTDDGVYTVDDLNAYEFDKLKQQIDNMYDKMDNDPLSPSRSKSVLLEVRRSVRDELSKVEGYDELTKHYQEAQELLEGLDDAFPLKVLDKAGQDAALKKVIDILRIDREYGRALLNNLEQQTQTPLFAEIVGSQFADELPVRQEYAKLGQGGESVGQLSVRLGLGLLSPLAQPVFWGEVLRAIGWSARQSDKAVSWMSRNRSKLVAVARELEEAKRHEEQTDPGFQESKIDPILDKVTNPQQRSALQQVADQGIRANRDVDRLLESFTRSPKY